LKYVAEGIGGVHPAGEITERRRLGAFADVHEIERRALKQVLE
jgi:hypothetical protein